MNILDICEGTAAVVTLDASAADAVRVMLENGVGAAAVVDENEVVAGIFTERDVMRSITLSKRDPETIPVREVMTTPVVLATSDIGPAEALSVMVEAHHRHLPIVNENGKLLGMLSLRHVLQFKVDELAAQLGTVQRA